MAEAGEAFRVNAHARKGWLWVLTGAAPGCLLLLFLSGIYCDILWLLFG